MDSPLIYLGGTGLAGLNADTPVWLHRGGTGTRLPLQDAVAQAGSKLQIIMGCADALLTQVSLSRKQARHLHRILPYLLEEQLLQAPEELWFVARKTAAEHYEVIVLERRLLDNLKAVMAELGAKATSLKVDADLLADLAPLEAHCDPWQLFMKDRQTALVSPPDQQQSLRPLFGNALEEARVFAGVEALLEPLAENASAGKGQEILQRAYATDQKTSRSQVYLAPWKPLMALAAAVFLLTLVALWGQQWRYQQAADQALAQAKARYETLFPGDKATGALRRQFRARLNGLSRSGDTQQQGFLPLLAPVAQVLEEMSVSPKRLQYDQRQDRLLLDVGAKDYAQLEALQGAIRDQGVQASIANYRNGASGVSARLNVEQSG